MKKNKYTYYRCTGYRGKCELPYFREEELGQRLGQILQNIHIPDEIPTQLEKSLLTDKDRQEAARKLEEARLQQRLAMVRRRLDQAYLDKLDGRISEEFWRAKAAEWQQEEQTILTALDGLQEAASPERVLSGIRILELANKAHSLYLRQTPAEQAKLLKMVLSNCAVDAAHLYPAYRKPFDLTSKEQERENGGPGETRTPDTWFRKPLLCPSELQAQLIDVN